MLGIPSSVSTATGILGSSVSFSRDSGASTSLRWAPIPGTSSPGMFTPLSASKQVLYSDPTSLQLMRQSVQAPILEVREVPGMMKEMLGPPSMPTTIVQEVVKDVSKVVTEHQTVIREVPNIEIVEKIVEVPEIKIIEDVVEVPTVLVQEELEEVEQILQYEVMKQVAKVEYHERVKQVPMPVATPRERLVEVQHTLLQERILEVPQMHYADCVKEVVKPVQQKVQKVLHTPVVQCQERVVGVPHVITKEQIEEVPKIELCEMVRQVPRMELHQVDKLVTKPQVQLVEKLVEVPKIDVQEKIVEVPNVVTCEYIKQIPKIEVQYIEKHVEKPIIQYVEKIVEVPKVVYEERIVEVPEIEVQEVVRHVAVPVVRYVDKPVQRTIMQYTDKFIDVPTTLQADQAVEVPQSMPVEVVTQRPVPQIQEIIKEIPKHTVEVVERVVEQPVQVREENIVEVPEVHLVDTVTQVLSPRTEYIHKPVTKVVEMQVVEKEAAVPLSLVEEKAVEVPQQQIVELLREEHFPVIQEVFKHVPKVQMNYVETVVEVQSTMHQETISTARQAEGATHDSPIQQQVLGWRSTPVPPVTSVFEGGRLSQSVRSLPTPTSPGRPVMSPTWARTARTRTFVSSTNVVPGSLSRRLSPQPHVYHRAGATPALPQFIDGQRVLAFPTALPMGPAPFVCTAPAFKQGSPLLWTAEASRVVPPAPRAQSPTPLLGAQYY